MVTNSMNQLTMMANIVGVIVVAFVTVAFITLAILLLGMQKRLCLGGLEDEGMRRDIKARLAVPAGKCRSIAEYRAYFAHQRRRQLVLHRLACAVCTLLFAAVLAFLLFSHLAGGQRHVWLKDTALLTIQTDSMASAHRNNTELFDAAGNADDAERLPQYSLISISREPSHIASIREGDVVAFTMTAEDGRTEITVVHRLIRMETDADGVLRLTFRGDANAESMAGERQITLDRVVGVFRSDAYRGFESLFLGHLVCYLRSSTGIAMTATALLLVLIYLALSDRLDRIYVRHYLFLLDEELQSLFPKVLILEHQTFKNKGGGV